MAGKRGQKSIAVLQIDIYGKEVAKYLSMGAASRATGIAVEGINRAVNYKTKSAGGYRWRKVNESYVPKLISKLDYPTRMAIINRHIYYPEATTRELAEWFDVSHTTIETVINNHKQSIRALERITAEPENKIAA